MAVEDAPKNVVDSAVRAAGLIGDGLYGVDLKQSAGRCYVIEVNDNPNIDAGFEDQVLKDKLYLRIMESFLRRIEKR
jgi:glutathione synthase/RimK-type ligase-like ATP-grasp enzyme